MDFKFDWKPFILDLLLTFTLPSFFVSLVKNSSQYQAWIVGTILACCIQLGLWFLLKYTYALINQAPKNFRDTIQLKFESSKIQNTKLMIKMLIALPMASVTISGVAFVGAFVAVGCIIKSISLPHIEKITAGADGDKS